jgi:hypothetical protein
MANVHMLPNCSARPALYEPSQFIAWSNFRYHLLFTISDMLTAALR